MRLVERFLLNVTITFVAVVSFLGVCDSEAPAQGVLPRTGFQYVTPSSCPEGTDIVYWVHTRPSTFEKRQLIRTTWGNRYYLHRSFGYNSILRFFIGQTDNATTRMIGFESEKYGDIVQADYIDSYQNLTYKAVSGLQWVVNRCRNLTAVIKADDDTIINIPRLIDHVNRVENIATIRNTIVCPVVSRAKVLRDKSKSKWAVPVSVFKPRYYPPYCQGLAMLLTPDILPRLLKRSEITPFFWIDDVYFTGLLTQPLGVRMLSLSRAQITEFPSVDGSLGDCTVAVHTINYTEPAYRLFWSQARGSEFWPKTENDPECYKFQKSVDNEEVKRPLRTRKSH